MKTSVRVGKQPIHRLSGMTQTQRSCVRSEGRSEPEQAGKVPEQMASETSCGGAHTLGKDIRSFIHQIFIMLQVLC